MIRKELINPKSIVVVGGSNNIQKPGGKILKNIVDGNYKGKIYVLNPKENEVQGIRCFQLPAALPEVDMAIIAIAAKYTLDVVKELTETKNTKAFIIISAGYSEESEEGKILEQKIVEQINRHKGCLIGPNCVGILTPYHTSVFTLPIPKLNQHGCDFVSGSGATACFIMEAGIPKGLTFANVFSVGNSAQIGVEEVLQYFDETFDSKTSSKVKLLYIENIDKPLKLLKHARSLIEKGCRIAAIKAGSSEAGSRAASSHTGALASSDVAIDALFRKAGIVRCYSREELISVASVMMYPQLKEKNIAVISHAGGPAVMLTDALSKGGLKVPKIKSVEAENLLEKLFSGSSVANPIDFLATGTKEQLGIIIDYVNQKFDEIDAMVVIFGTPGLFKIFDVYELLSEKMNASKKPIYPVLPSIITAKEETESFIETGKVFFSDEVSLGNALAKVYNTPQPASIAKQLEDFDVDKIRKVIESNESGYLLPDDVSKLLDACNIPRIKEAVVQNIEEAEAIADEFGFPLVMKVVGTVHKTDVGGISLNIKDKNSVYREFKRLMSIQDSNSVLIQKMAEGVELFAGAKKESPFGHLIFCGLGGIMVEAMKDVASVLAPIQKDEALLAIHSLKAQMILEGVRGQAGINKESYADILVRLSSLLHYAPEIDELDLNPIMGTGKNLKVVDSRVRLELK